MAATVRELAIQPVLDELTGGEQSLLFGMIESELINGMALVPKQLEQASLALIEKCEGIIERERVKRFGVTKPE